MRAAFEQNRSAQASTFSDIQIVGQTMERRDHLCRPDVTKKSNSLPIEKKNDHDLISTQGFIVDTTNVGSISGILLTRIQLNFDLKYSLFDLWVLMFATGLNALTMEEIRLKNKYSLCKMIFFSLFRFQASDLLLYRENCVQACVPDRKGEDLSIYSSVI